MRLPSFAGRMRNPVFLSIIAVALIGLSCLPACQPGGSGQADSITLGTSLLETAAPIFVAEDRGIFAANGLDVTIKYYDTGLAQYNGMLKGEVNICGPTAEYILVSGAFKGDKIRVVACIDTLDYFRIVARKDSGISDIGDLKGKKVALAVGTIAEFYLGRSLELKGMSLKDVHLVNAASFPKAADAVASGEVDACVTPAPFAVSAVARLGGNAFVWPAQSGQAIYTLMICPQTWVSQRPATIERVIRSIKSAEDYMIQHPEETKGIIRKKLGVSDSEVSDMLSRNQFSLSLDQALIYAMEDESRWMIGDNLTAQSQVPDFLSYIYIDGLNTVVPGAVNIIR